MKKLHEEPLKIYKDLKELSVQRGKIIESAIHVEDMCEKIILSTFILKERRLDFLSCALANDVAIGFRVKTEIVGYVLKNYPAKCLTKNEVSKIVSCLEDITSFRNHAAHRKWSIDESNRVHLNHIKTKGGINKTSPVYISSIIGGFFSSCGTVSIGLSKYLKEKSADNEPQPA